MARFNLSQAKSYSGNQGSGVSKDSFFKLVNDGDTAMVRFILEKPEDMDIYLTHEVVVNVNGKSIRKKVDCPQDDCPLCAEGKKTSVRLFLPMEVDGVAKVWERGSNFIGTMETLFKKFGKKNDLFKVTFEIERNGAKGSTDTTYSITPVIDDEGMLKKDAKLKIEDMPDKVKILGGVVGEYDVEGLKQFTDGGTVSTPSKPSEKENKKAVKKESKPAKTKGKVIIEDDEDLPF